MRTAILAVDDDPVVLASVARDLRARYGRDHLVLRSSSGSEALVTLHDLKQRGDVAIVLVVDQRMPEMSGTEFLLEAKELFPDARSVLLTAYADTEAAIVAINRISLDHYLLKPWDPPEEHLYPVIDEQIDAWLSEHPPPFEGIRIVDSQWSAQGHLLRDFLTRNRIPYRFLDIARDPEAADIERAHSGELPTVLLEDGTVMHRPDILGLAHHVGLQTIAREPFYDLVIVGAGPAGLGAAVYAASEGLSTAVIERAAPGGQAGTSSRIENYLGFDTGISGSDLAKRAAAQAKRFGAELLTGPEVVTVVAEENLRTVRLADGGTIGSKALIVASGMSIRRLGVPEIEQFVGAGVYYGAAPSEAKGYEGANVFVVGGANSAGQAALMLATFAGSVTLLVRGTSLESGMSQYLVDRIRDHDRIDVRLRTAVVGAAGDGHLELVTLKNLDTDETEAVEATGLFIFVGAVPHSGFLDGVVTLSPHGFVLTGPDLKVGGEWPPEWPLERDPYLMETSVPGIFAAGDVRDGVVRRVATAVGQGAVCVTLVHQYLATI